MKKSTGYRWYAVLLLVPLLLMSFDAYAGWKRIEKVNGSISVTTSANDTVGGTSDKIRLVNASQNKGWDYIRGSFLFNVAVDIGDSSTNEGEFDSGYVYLYTGSDWVSEVIWQDSGLVPCTLSFRYSRDSLWIDLTDSLPAVVIPVHGLDNEWLWFDHMSMDSAGSSTDLRSDIMYFFEFYSEEE